MKSLLLFLTWIAAGLAIVFFLRSKPITSSSFVATATPTPKLNEAASARKSSLFVPYWTLTKADLPTNYDALIYYGVTPGTSGVNTKEAGYLALPKFTAATAGRTTYLALRMLDSKQDFAILSNSSQQDKLIADTITTAKENNFSGVVLDLELTALPFDSLVTQVSSFNKRFYQAAQKNNLHYGLTLYGDTFYRIRPFDVKTLAKNSDEVYIMAYDLHKSRGNPGPNFPLSGKNEYGYDYSVLLSDFTQAVPRSKLTVVFGLFGYDWTVNKDNAMLAAGVPLSYNQIKSEFLTQCPFSPCILKRDSLSTESSVTYTATDGAIHQVWFEDLDSVAKKRSYLQQQGINSYSYWAYSYF